MPLQVSADSREEERPGLGILEDLAVDGLSQANKFGPNHDLGHGLVEGQAVEHEGDQLGNVQDDKLAEEVGVDGADVLQKDDLLKGLIKLVICRCILYKKT